MTISAKQNNFRKSVNNIIMIVVMMFSVVAFSQSPDNNSLADALVEPVSNTAEVSTSRNSNVEFVLWFMGTKQNPNSTISTEGNSTRNQIITSGLAPNRLLIKAFLKKAVNFETSLV
ncbi:hypothetical protein SLW70_07035 [Flavobacterium sp. NG2]|uniref:hypothetical protein n=1 Tax=Flavobacterium sp. NG2 TaxID=3097547 RepID=UPI002A829F4A|nr:hypothetical protein [Flavobacterium sp. NG2]WPR72873.1 hypothetical protein SLW70_07035 [Flavobacterium sp. NG2]